MTQEPKRSQVMPRPSAEVSAWVGEAAGREAERSRRQGMGCQPLIVSLYEVVERQGRQLEAMAAEIAALRRDVAAPDRRPEAAPQRRPTI